MSAMPRGEEMRPAPRVKLTYDDFLLFPDDGQRHELIDGEHYVTPSPATIHQRIVGNIYFRMRQFLETHAIGEVFLAPFDIVFGEHDVVEPDLLYVSAVRRDAILTKLHVRGVPDLVVEVGSPGTRKRDETIKRRLYERTGVREYWVVDPDLEVIRVYRHNGDLYGRPLELAHESDDVLVSIVIPDFALPLADVFRIPS
jgi:Uma2 family endonuclease